MPRKNQVERPSAGRPGFWSGTLSFGLVNIPVNLYPANRSSHLELHMVAPDGTLLQRRYYSSVTGRELAPEELVRGYQLEKDHYVVVTDDELERLDPQKSSIIDLRRFVPAEAIPPLYFERGYFLAPGAESTKAYQLLATVMAKTRRAGIAAFVMRGEEYWVAIIAEKGILCAETMRFKDELRTPEDIGLPKTLAGAEKKVRNFERIINQYKEQQLARAELQDETSAALLEIVKAKQSKKENVFVSSEPGEQTAAPDLLAELKRSLAAHGHLRSDRAGTVEHRRRRAAARYPKPRQDARSRALSSK